MLERESGEARGSPHPNTADTAETVIALGKDVYRFYKRRPELVTFDATTLWRIMNDAYAEDGRVSSRLAAVEDSQAWVMAVGTAQLLHALYAAGGLDEEPA